MNKRKLYGMGSLAFFGVLVLTGCNGEISKEDVQNKVASSQAMQERNMKGSEAVGKQEKIREEDHSVSIEGIPLGDISVQEKADILKMREEEKLARDIYMALGEKWGKNVFLNIQQSEQTHMDEMKLLIDRYELTDPVGDDVIGNFDSPDMQKLYDDLVAQGQTSLLAALTVGATVEDLDIKDLQDALARTDNEDVKIIYTNLMEGSQKHLQSFVKNITKEGGTYEPQFISQDDYDSIIAMERITGGKSSGGGQCVNDGGEGCGLHDGSGAGQGNGGAGGNGGNY